MFNWIRIIRKILRLIYEFLFIVLIIDFGVCLSGGDMMGMESLIALAGVLVVSYIARDKVSHAISLSIIHVILGILVFFLMHDMYMKIILDVVLLGIFIDAAMYMKRGFFINRAFDAPWDVFFVGIAVTILAYYLKNNELQMFVYFASIIMMLDYLVSLYIEGLDSYIELNKSVVGLPMRQMISINSFIVTTVIAIIIVTIFLADLFGLPKVVAGFVLAFLALIRILIVILGFIMRFVFGFFTAVPVDHKRAAEEIEEIAREESILSRILYFVMVAMVIAFAVYVLIRICKILVTWLISKQDRRYEIIEKLDTKKKKGMVKIHIEKETDYGINSNEQKARRIYKKKVISFRRFFLPDRTDTTSDIEEAILKFTPDDEESISSEKNKTLKEMYEAVRYGNKVPDRDYLRKMKQL